MLTNQDGSLNEAAVEPIVNALAALQKSGKQVALVTCGAIPAGVTRLRLPSYPAEIKAKQAAAAVGQPALMNIYDKFFGLHGITVAQLLLSKYTVQRDDVLSNVTNTISILFGLGVIPIINENDSIVTDELKLGDNDMLAAYVSNIICADLLLILTSVDGLCDRDPRRHGAKVIPEVTAITEQIKSFANGPKTAAAYGTGGMATKLAAAVTASRTKTKTIIMNGFRPHEILDALAGATVGTYIDLMFR